MTFGYRTSQGKVGERTVDAFAMVFRRGHWYLVGHDRDRAELRAFRLSRFTTEITDVGEGQEPPDGFKATDHVEAGPWAAAGEDTAVVTFSPAVAWWATGSFAGAEPDGEDADGWVRVRVPVADEDSLAGIVLQFGPDALVHEPASLRDEVIRRLEALGA